MTLLGRTMYNIIILKESKGVSTMKKKVIILIGLLVAVIVVIAGVYNMESNNDKQTETYHKAKKSTSAHKDKKTTYKTKLVDDVKNFSKGGKSIDEMYVTGSIKVGDDSELKPGIYDLQITGGSGNVAGERAQTSAPFINYFGDAKGSLDTQGIGDAKGASKIRLILFSGDVLNLDDISKVKFTAVSQFNSSNQLGQGEYVVGLDVPAGTYKLSSNVKFDPEFDNLGWTIDVWGKNGGNQRKQYNSSTNDVVVKLDDGDVVSTDNTYAGRTPGITADQEKLIFNKFE